MKFGARPVDIRDDEVVASFNVYVSPALVNQAHIFQYPLRRKQRPYEATETKLFSTSGAPSDEGDAPASKRDGAAVFSAASRLTMKCSLDTFGSPSFRAPLESGADLVGQMEVQRQHTYNYTLHSQPFTPQSNYVLGYVTTEGIHLTPVSTIQQFTPALGIPESGTGAVRVADPFCSQANAAMVPGFAAADRAQRELQRQRSSTLNREASTAQEVQFFRADSVESSAMRSRLRSSTLESVIGGGLNPASEPGRVENSLFPPEILASGGISGGDEAHPSMIIHRFASRRSVAEQTSQLIQRCHIATLPVVQSVVAPHTSSELVKAHATVPAAQVVEALRVSAVWMHGVWVSRYCDQFRGSVAALREVILMRFYQSTDGSVSRADMNALVSTSSARRSIKEILATVAVLNADEPDPSRRRWRLKYVSANRAEREECVRAFKAAFPAEEASQQEAWRRRCAQVMSHIPYINANRPPPQLFFRSRGAAPSSATAGGGSAGLPFGGTPTASAPPIGSVPGASASPYGSPTASGADMGFKDADIAPIRHFIRELFAEHGVINKQRVKELVIKAQEARFPHASKAMLSAALQQSLDKFTDATWVLKAMGEPLVDYYRPTILSVALTLRQFEMVTLVARVEEIVRERGLTAPPGSAATRGRTENPLETVAHRVVSEVAEFKAAERRWHLKNGSLMNE